MEILPTFTIPDHNEALFLHLATPPGGISAILLAERRKIYIPIYFANRTLQEIEQNDTKTKDNSGPGERCKVSSKVFPRTHYTSAHGQTNKTDALSSQ